VKVVAWIFGPRLSAVRVARGLSQTEFAAALGKSEQTVWAWEDVICHQVALSDLKRCARVLRCSVRDLLGPTGDPIPPVR